MESASSKYSIKQKLEAKNEEETPIFNQGIEKELPNNHFTDTDLQTEWKIFLETLQSKDVVIYNAVNGFKLTKKDEDIIEILYPSLTAKAEFEKVSSDFFNAFKHKVNHHRIQFEYKKDSTNLKVELVTTRSLFEKYVQINPLLKDLDDLLKFDFNG